MTGYMEKYSPGWSEDSVRLIATPSAAARSAYFYVQEAGHFKTQPHYFTEREHLNSYLAVFTAAGKGVLHYKGKTYTLLPGSVFFIDCMEYQYYETDKEELWEILWVHFNGATSRGYYDQFAKNGSPVVALGQNPAIPSILRQLIDAHRTKDIRTEQLSSKLLVELLTELLFAANAVDAAGYVLPNYIQAAMGFMEKHFREKLSLDRLASSLSMSKFHLSREFKKYTGLSPNEYLINTRITYAKELLKYSELSVAEIAEKAGVENVSHFISLFRDRVGITPLAFRNKWQSPR